MATQKNSLDTWKASKRHKVMLPSGTEVEIEIPDLLKMIEAGEVPNKLLDAAAETQTVVADVDEKVDVPKLLEQYEFVRFIVAKTVVEPALEEADVRDLPAEDVAMLVQFATRDRDMDALHRHIGGLHTNATFRKFRSFPSLAEDGAGL